MSVTAHALAVVAICAGVTMLLRAAPFAFFGGRGGVPRLVRALGTALPPAIMAALVVYCLRTVPYGTARDALAQLLAAAAVVIAHRLRRNTLLSIAAGTALYMILIRIP